MACPPLPLPDGIHRSRTREPVRALSPESPCNCGVVWPQMCGTLQKWMCSAPSGPRGVATPPLTCRCAIQGGVDSVVVMVSSGLPVPCHRLPFAGVRTPAHTTGSMPLPRPRHPCPSLSPALRPPPLCAYPPGSLRTPMGWASTTATGCPRHPFLHRCTHFWPRTLTALPNPPLTFWFSNSL